MAVFNNAKLQLLLCQYIMLYISIYITRYKPNKPFHLKLRYLE